MNNPTPKFGKLYLSDSNIKSSIQMIFGSLLFQLVTYMGFEMFYPPIVIGLATLTVIGIIFFVYTYNLIMTTYREGITIKGKVIDIERFSVSTKNGGRKKRYYAVIQYMVGGEDYKKKFLLTAEPVFYGITQGEDVELILREEKPKTVFIKHIYLD